MSASASSSSSSFSAFQEDFCGEPFWDNQLSWNTTSPQFTRCFRQTVLVTVPCFFLWIFAPLEGAFIATSKSRLIPWNALNITRLLFVGACIILNLWELVSGYSEDASSSDTFAPLIKVISFVLLGVFLAYHRSRGIGSSGIVWLFLFFTIIFTIPIYYQLWAHRSSFHDNEYYVYLIYFPGLLGLFVLCSFTDLPPTYKRAPSGAETSVHEDVSEIICPEDSASFPSRLTFWWFNQLAYLGWKKPLAFTDLWSLRHEDKTSTVGPDFNKNWHKQCTKRCPIRDQKAVSFSNSEVQVVRTTPVFVENKNKPGVTRALITTFGWSFLSGAVFKLGQDILQFTNPQLLKWLIQFIESGPNEPLWHGLFISFLMFAVALAQSLMLNFYFNQMFVVGMRIRTCLTAAIYRKSLNLSNEARKQTTVGEIVNLMSVDSQRFMDLLTYLNLIWSAPLQIGIAIYFLWVELGPSVLAGLGVMVLMLPMNAVMAGASKKMQEKQMKQKDERVKSMNEILNGIKVLKLYAWEESFMAGIFGLRDKEVSQLRSMAYLGSVTMFLWTCAPFLVALISFAIYVLSDPSNVLTAQKAFVSLALFNLLRFPLTMLPQLITFLVMAAVSVKRLNRYLYATELRPYVTHNDNEVDAVTIEEATFTWERPSQELDPISSKSPPECTLRDIHFQVPRGAFVAVVGNVGSGKSSLMSALLGEMDLIKGQVNTCKDMSIAYVPQQAWIQNATLRNNILFGTSFDRRKYDRTIYSCALKPDLLILPGGDETEIGEKGINLSGGQKQRINLARACYSNANLYLMDDPLSAVDSHVAKHLFDKVLSSKTGLLKNKTRILVTNNLSILPQVDKIIVLKDGLMSEMGTYKELMARKKEFADFITQFSTSKHEGSPAIVRQESIPEDSLVRSLSIHKENEEKNKLIEAEMAETGKVKFSVYLRYFKTLSMPWLILMVVGFVGLQVASAGSNVWLSLWSNDQPTVDGNQDIEMRNMRLTVYGLLGLAQGLLVFLGAFSLARGSMNAAITLHRSLLERVLRAPMYFFDTTPLGRIVNRFSKDIDTVDQAIPMSIRSWLLCFLQVIATLAVIAIATPLFLVIIAPVALVYYFIQKFYVATTRQLKRLESITRSPIYSHFGETLAGVSTIRAYGSTQRFIEESDQKLDHNQICYYPSIVSNRWLAVRLEFCGNCISLFAALFAVYSRDTLTAGMAGLSVSYALSVTQTLNWLVRMSSELENNIVSVERIMEYSAIPSEAEWYDEQNKPPTEWPQKGQIQFEHYASRYRPGLDLVIKDITADIKPGEKIGIVGRTGAGKSTITLSLFRLIEPAAGSILVDNVDIGKLGLHDLRMRLTIIPQDPVLFSGTLRTNLDPFQVKSDDQLWKALEQAHLKQFVTSLEAGLGYKVSEGGENLSVGQRQLVCLARALLRKTRILILDEATAAVDLETDFLIQSTIRNEFKECTILTIAHRLNTILDSNRVMVLDKGAIVEFDSPQTLLADPDSVFYSLAKDAGLV